MKRQIEREERGFTLVEIMVALAIFLIILGVVFELYIFTTKFVTYMQAKSAILDSVSSIYDIYRPYFYGAYLVKDPSRLELGEVYDYSKPESFESIEFLTKIQGETSESQDVWFLITTTTTGRYIIDPIDNTTCIPQTKVIILRKFYDMGETPTITPDMGQWYAWLKSGDAKISSILPLMGGANTFSQLSIQFDPYSVGANGGSVKWYKLHVTVTVGIRQYVYSDPNCQHVYDKFPVSLYPYSIVFSLNFINKESY